jgi:hypothetical protein
MCEVLVSTPSTLRGTARSALDARSTGDGLSGTKWTFTTFRLSGS